jgi:hypothetical protein
MVVLASLRSPYAAPFVLSTLIVFFVVLAGEVRDRRGVAAFVAVLAMFSIATPPSFDPWVLMAASLVRTVALYALLVWAVLRRERALTASRPPSTAGTT